EGADAAELGKRAINNRATAMVRSHPGDGGDDAEHGRGQTRLEGTELVQGAGERRLHHAHPAAYPIETRMTMLTTSASSTVDAAGEREPPRYPGAPCGGAEDDHGPTTWLSLVAFGKSQNRHHHARLMPVRPPTVLRSPVGEDPAPRNPCSS